MTDSNDRLDRIEALLATVAESNAASVQRLDLIESGLARTEKIVESNARAIEAWGNRTEEANDVTNRRMEDAITDTVAMIAELGERHREVDQRFEVFLAEARADRQLAEQRHQAWLTDSARLWERIAE